MGRTLLSLLLLLASSAYAIDDIIGGSSGAKWEAKGSPKTYSPIAGTQCVRIGANAAAPRLCNLSGAAICVDTDNNSTTCELTINADGTISLPAALSRWEQPWGPAGSSLLYAPDAGNCHCWVCPLSTGMPGITHISANVAIPDNDDVVRLGVYSFDGVVQYFSCQMDVTTGTSQRSCTNTVSVVAVPAGNAACCMSAGDNPANAFRAAGDSDLTTLKWSQLCSGGSMPSQLLSMSFTRLNSAVPAIQLIYAP